MPSIGGNSVPIFTPPGATGTAPVTPGGNQVIQTGPNSTGTAGANPYTPAGNTAAPAPYSDDPAGTSPNTYASNVQPIVPGGVTSNNLQTQLTDIYGQGVGASLFNLLNNMSGTDSTALQEYEQSLVPQEAAASANIGASLGASGVSGNSSVNAIAQSNLGAQETAAVAGEAEQLQMSQEQLTAQILEGTEGAASKEVSSSGWNVLGDVLQGVAGNTGSILSGVADVMDASGSSGSSSTSASPVNTEDLSAALFE
jgi:hypothetical protein